MTIRKFKVTMTIQAAPYDRGSPCPTGKSLAKQIKEVAKLLPSHGFKVLGIDLEK